MNWKLLGVAGAAAMGLAGTAVAADLTTFIAGSTRTGVVTDGDGVPQIVPNGVTAAGSWSASDGLANASASLTGAPSILLTASGDASAGGRALAAASIAYSFTVNGPADFADFVPIRFVANLSASAAASRAATGTDGEPVAIAGASFNLGGDLYSAGPTFFTTTVCTSRCVSGNYAQGAYVGGVGAPSLSYLVSGLAGLRVGGIGWVAETASIDAGVGSIYFAGETAQAWASADPYFFIDPDFAFDHPDFSLSFSSSVVNSPPSGGVPEPASWALMLTGFGALGAAMRRQRARAIAPT